MLKAKRMLALIPTLSLLVVPSVFADTYQIDGTAPNAWPAMVSFTAPCGVMMYTPNDPGRWDPPGPIADSDPNSLPPTALCADTMRTLTDPPNVMVTTLGAVNPSYTKMPDGSPVPITSSILNGGVNKPQDPQNTPTPIVEVSASGTVEFLVPMTFKDTTNSKFEGRTDGLIEVPYDANICPNTPGADQNTGLPRASLLVPATLCLITTPTQYIAALRAQHVIQWAEISGGASLVAYGPTDTQVPSTAQSWQRQSSGGKVTGTLNIPFATDNNSTVLRLAVRYSIGYDGQNPLAWGGWPTPPCTELNCLAPAYWTGMQTAWVFSQPFTLQVQPAALIQFHYLPSFILYQPPGNQSTADITISDKVTQKYVLSQATTITDQTEYDQKSKSDLSFSPSNSIIKESPVGGTADFSTSSTWDKSDRSTTAENYGQTVSSSVTAGKSYTYPTPKLGSSAPDVSHLTFRTEPFWSDEITISMHPQFAVWDYPAGLPLQPRGTAGLIMLSVETLADALPLPLTPASQAGISIQLADGSTDKLSWTECADLLSLDPFYVALSQAAVPAMGIPELPPQSLPLGAIKFQAQKITDYETSGNYTKTIKGTITSSETNTNTVGINDTLYGQKLGVSASYTLGSTMADEVDVVLGSTVSATTENNVTADINLGDCPLAPVPNKPGQLAVDCDPPPVGQPPNAEMYMDTRFGTLMGRLPNLKIAPPQPKTVPAAALSADLTAVGLSNIHLSIPHSNSSSSSNSLSSPSNVRKLLAVTSLGPPKPIGNAGARQPAPPLPARAGHVAPLSARWAGRVIFTAAPVSSPVGPPAHSQIVAAARTARSKTPAVATLTPATRTVTPVQPAATATATTNVAAVRTVPGVAVRTVTSAPSPNTTAAAQTATPVAQPVTRGLAAAPAIAAGSPDLSIALADVHLSPAAPQAGQSTTFSAVVRNLGTGAAQNATIVFRLYANGKQVAISQPVAFSVAAHGTYQAHWAAPAPAGASTQVVVSVTASGDLNGANNQATLPFGATTLSPQRPQ